MDLLLRYRRRSPEWMDRPDADISALRSALAYIRKMNVLLQYVDVTLKHLDQFAAGWKRGETIRILDVATGSADIPRAILKWADEKGHKVEIVGVDLHSEVLKIAEEEGFDPRLKLMRADATQLPFDDGSFDYVHTAMFLHHLDEDAALKVLLEMTRVAGRGIIATDLLRSARAYAWITLFTLFATPMVKHDARASVVQAFSWAEAMNLRNNAGLSYTELHRHFAHRFAIVGEKQII